jgi:hypothetical protein
MWLRDVDVCANELALTKAHVRLEAERHAGTGRRVGSGAAAADMSQFDDPLKSVIWDQRNRGIERIVMDEDRERSEGRQAPGDRVRAALIVIISTGWGWT